MKREVSFKPSAVFCMCDEGNSWLTKCTHTHIHTKPLSCWLVCVEICFGFINLIYAASSERHKNQHQHTHTSIKCVWKEDDWDDNWDFDLKRLKIFFFFFITKQNLEDRPVAQCHIRFMYVNISKLNLSVLTPTPSTQPKSVYGVSCAG